MKKATVRSPKVTIGGLFGDDGRPESELSVTTKTQFTNHRSAGRIEHKDMSNWGKNSQAPDVLCQVNTTDCCNDIYIAEGDEAVVMAELTSWSSDTVRVQVGREIVTYISDDSRYMDDLELLWDMTVDQAKQLVAELSAVIAKTQTPYNSEELAAAVFGS